MPHRRLQRPSGGCGSHFLKRIEISGCAADLESKDLPDNDWVLCGRGSEYSHLLSNTAHSKLASECRTLQKNA
jgi:hypothetical protein